MKIVILNGSPRKGNTLTAIEALLEGFSPRHEVEVIDTTGLSIAPCKGCNSCGCANGCIDKDDTNATVDKIVAADLILWATPVYWWGVSAQLKLVMDKCYCRGALLRGKKIGLVVVGGASVDAKQYELIRDQFACIEKSLGWEMMLFRKYSATAKKDLAADTEAMEELTAAAAAL